MKTVYPEHVYKLVNAHTLFKALFLKLLKNNFF